MHSKNACFFLCCFAIFLNQFNYFNLQLRNKFFQNKFLFLFFKLQDMKLCFIKANLITKFFKNKYKHSFFFVWLFCHCSRTNDDRDPKQI